MVVEELEHVQRLRCEDDRLPAREPPALRYVVLLSRDESVLSEVSDRP